VEKRKHVATGRPKGGRRLGAGRKPGKAAKHRMTMLMEVLPKLAEPDRQLPLYRLLDRIADESLDPKYRDVLAIACLPYLHARMPATLIVKPEYLMTDEELVEVRRAQEEHERQVALGRGQVHLVKEPK
jgi:hypothetical protein